MSDAPKALAPAAGNWDKEAIYDAEVAPLMAQIIEICKREDIPLVASFKYAHNIDGAGEDGLCTTVVPGANQPEEFKRAAMAIYSPRDALLLLTTRDSEGRAKRMDAIL
jgi:hypothetical protein